ncbi:hypothetical protein Tco_0347784 [Tanacetum coccineum]
MRRLLAIPTHAPSPPYLISLSPPSAEERLARCTAPSAHSSPPPIPSPLLPSSGCPTQIQTLRIASTQALINAVTATLPSPPLPPSLYRPPLVDRIREVGYGIKDTWVDPAEAVPEIAPMTVGEVNTRVIKLAELHEHDTQDLYALLEDAQDVWIVEEEAYASREAWAHSIGLSQAVHHELQTHRDHVYAHESQLHAHQTQLQLQGTLIQTQHQVHETRSQMQQAEMARAFKILEPSKHKGQMGRDCLRVIGKEKNPMRREMGDMQAELLALRGQQRARQPAPDARVPDHQDASRDADSHI